MLVYGNIDIFVNDEKKIRKRNYEEKLSIIISLYKNFFMPIILNTIAII